MVHFCVHIYISSWFGFHIHIFRNLSNNDSIVFEVISQNLLLLYPHHHYEQNYSFPLEDEKKYYFENEHVVDFPELYPADIETDELYGSP